MQSSRRHVLFVSGLAAAVLILLGEVVVLGSDSCSRSSGAVLAPNSSEGCAVFIPSFTYIDQGSEGKGELEKQLRLLLEELKGLQKDAEEKFRKDILPYLKREIEKLRNRLKEFSPGKEKTPQPQRVQV